VKTSNLTIESGFERLLAFPFILYIGWVFQLQEELIL
jgi:hypothetical protein